MARYGGGLLLLFLLALSLLATLLPGEAEALTNHRAQYQKILKKRAVQKKLATRQSAHGTRTAHTSGGHASPQSAVLYEPIKLVLVFYGLTKDSWPEEQKDAVRKLIAAIPDASQEEEVYTPHNWWNVARLYKDPQGNKVSGTISIEADVGVVAGLNTLSLNFINSILLDLIDNKSIPKVDNAVYAFLTAADIKVTGGYRKCSWHHAGAVLYFWAGVPPETSRCGPKLASGYKYPNNDKATTVLVSEVARMLVNTAVDPYRAKETNVGATSSACQGQKYGDVFYNEDKVAYNKIGPDGTLYLLPAIENPETGTCAGELVLPPEGGSAARSASSSSTDEDAAEDVEALVDDPSFEATNEPLTQLAAQTNAEAEPEGSGAVKADALPLPGVMGAKKTASLFPGSTSTNTGATDLAAEGEEATAGSASSTEGMVKVSGKPQTSESSGVGQESTATTAAEAVDVELPDALSAAKSSVTGASTQGTTTTTGTTTTITGTTNPGARGTTQSVADDGAEPFSGRTFEGPERLDPYALSDATSSVDGPVKTPKQAQALAGYTTTTATTATTTTATTTATATGVTGPTGVTKLAQGAAQNEAQDVEAGSKAQGAAGAEEAVVSTGDPIAKNRDSTVASSDAVAEAEPENGPIDAESVDEDGWPGSIPGVEEAKATSAALPGEKKLAAETVTLGGYVGTTANLKWAQGSDEGSR